jgi:hypothetical protein
MPEQCIALDDDSELQFLLCNLLTNEELVNQLDWPFILIFGTKYKIWSFFLKCYKIYTFVS